MTQSEFVRYYAFARQALVEALRLIGVESGDEVLVPSLICKDVLASIHTLGATPVFFEVDHNLNPIGLDQISSSKAVLVVNYFGFAQDLAPFNRYCERTGAVLIEDNAHGHLSADPLGVVLGTRSPVGITSIRKTLRVPDGATLTVNSDVFAARLSPQLPFTNKALGARWTIQIFLASLGTTLHLPLIDWLRAPVRWSRKLKTGSALPISGSDSEIEHIVPAAPRQSSMSRIQRMDPYLELTRRRDLYKIISELAVKTSAVPVFNQLPDFCSPYGFPFYGDAETAQKMHLRTRRFGTEVIQWPELPYSVTETAPEHYKNLWLVNFL
jgi:hypothetical protein